MVPLANLSYHEIRKLHNEGTCPILGSLKGTANGEIAGSSLIAKMKVWRGKVFLLDENQVIYGYNRLGLGPFEIQRYKFFPRVADSAFSDRKVLFLDHDIESNPGWVRSFHDELVQVSDNQYLATSHQKVKDKLVFKAFFTLSFQSQALSRKKHPM